MVIEVGRLLPGDDNVIRILHQLFLAFKKGLADITLDAVAGDCISHFLADGQAQAKFRLIAFQDIDDKLAVRKRLPFFEDALKFLVLLDPLVLVHVFTCLCWFIPAEKAAEKKKKTTDAVSGLKLIVLFFLCDGVQQLLYVRFLCSYVL